MASKYDEFRQKYANEFQKYNKQYTGGVSNVQPVTQTASKYDGVRQKIASGEMQPPEYKSGTSIVVPPAVSTIGDINKNTLARAKTQNILSTWGKINESTIQRVAPKVAQQQAIDNIRAEHEAEYAKAPWPINKISSALDKFTYENPIGRAIAGISQGGLTATTGLKPEDVGDVTVGPQAAHVAGAIIAPLLNPAGIPGGINTPYSTPITNTLAGKVGSLVANPAASRIATEATREAIAGTPVSLGQSLMTGQVSPQQLASNAGYSIGLGLAGGAVGSALGRFMTRTRTATPEVEQQINRVLALPAPKERGNVNSAATPDIVYGEGSVSTPEPLALGPGNYQRKSNFRVANNNTALNKVMNEIKPIVTERMTPPLENPNQLAKWVQSHLGDDAISLNEVRQLPYEDLRQMAEMMRSRLNVADEAVKAAAERGYNLPELLNGGKPSIRKQASKFASQRAYGVYPDQLPNVQTPQFSRQVLGTAEAPIQRVGAANPAPKRVEPENVVAPNATPEELRSAADNLQSAVNNYRSSQESTSSPSSVNWFQRLFGNQGVGIKAGSSTGSVKTGTQMQIVSNAIKKDKEGMAAAVKTGVRNTYQTLVDSLSPIKRVFGQKAYDIAMDSNRASNIANTIVHDKFVDMEGNVLGKGMSEIFKQIPRGLDNEAVDYLILRDAKARIANGELVYDQKLGMNDVNKIQERLNKYEREHPELVNFGKDWDQFTKNIRTVYGLDSGLLNKEQLAAMEAKRPNYAPMRRQFALSERVKQSFMRSNSGFSGQKAPIQKVSPTGSVRKIVDPRRTMIEATQKWVQNAMNNRVLNYIGDEVMKDPEALKDIAEIVRTPTKTAPKLAKAFADSDQLEEAIKNGNEEEFLDDLSKQFRKLFDKAKSGEDTVLTYMKNGQPIAIRIKDPEAIRALASLGPQQTGVIVKALGFLSNLTKRSATGLFAPLFAVRQLTVDLPQALIQSPNAIAHLGDYTHAILSSVVEAIPGLRETKLADLANDFRRTGGVYSSLLKTEKGINKSMNSLKRNPYLSPQGIAQGVSTVAKAPFKALEKFGDIAENLNRMAAYKGAMRAAGGERTPENVRNAMNAAREITTNFSRKGTLAKEMEAGIPYNNAAIQGFRRFLVAYKQHPIQSTIGTLALAVTPKMIEYAMFGNDPDYQKIPARDRYRKLFISKRSNGSFVSIQLPPEYLAIGAFTEDLMRHYIGNDPQAMKGVYDALMNAYSPPLIAGGAQGATQGGGAEQSIGGLFNATSIGPITGVYANQSFTGSPIVPQSMNDVSPQYQYDEKTTAAAKELGKVLKWSPKKIDYLLKQYTGDIGRYILPLTSTTGSADTMRSLAKNFITDPVYTNTLSDDYYNAKNLLTTVEKDHGAVGTPLPKWYSDDIHTLLTSTAKGTVGAKLKELNQQKKQINADKKMSAAEKANKLRNLQVQINSLYVDVLSKLQEAGVPISGR